MLPVDGVSEVLYLPAPGRSDFGAEPAVAITRGRPARRLDPAGERTSRLPRDHGRLVRRAWAGPDDHAAADGAFQAQRLAQEFGRIGLFIDRSAEAAHAYRARAGFVALRAATGGNLNIAV